MMGLKVVGFTSLSTMARVVIDPTGKRRGREDSNYVPGNDANQKQGSMDIT
jgi:hypothetical protein